MECRERAFKLTQSLFKFSQFFLSYKFLLLSGLETDFKFSLKKLLFAACGGRKQEYICSRLQGQRGLGGKVEKFITYWEMRVLKHSKASKNKSKKTYFFACHIQKRLYVCRRKNSEGFIYKTALFLKFF